MRYTRLSRIVISCPSRFSCGLLPKLGARREWRALLCQALTGGCRGALPNASLPSGAYLRPMQFQPAIPTRWHEGARSGSTIVRPSPRRDRRSALEGVQERLGHSSIAITMDIHSHLMPNMQGEAAATVDVALRAAINKPKDFG